MLGKCHNETHFIQKKLMSREKYKFNNDYSMATFHKKIKAKRIHTCCQKYSQLENNSPKRNNRFQHKLPLRMRVEEEVMSRIRLEYHTIRLKKIVCLSPGPQYDVIWRWCLEALGIKKI
jgi:hypothetical protein